MGVSKFKRHLDKVLASQETVKEDAREGIDGCDDHDSTHGSLIETDDEEDEDLMDEQVDGVGLNPTSF